jgi:hypothetical protein
VRSRPVASMSYATAGSRSAAAVGQGRAAEPRAGACGSAWSTRSGRGIRAAGAHGGGPADHAAAEGVHHDAEEEPALVGGKVGDVGAGGAVWAAIVVHWRLPRLETPSSRSSRISLATRLRPTWT